MGQPSHCDKVAKPLVSQFVIDDDCHSLASKGRHIFIVRKENSVFDARAVYTHFGCIRCSHYAQIEWAATDQLPYYVHQSTKYMLLKGFIFIKKQNILIMIYHQI